MFTSSIHLHPSLITVDKAGSLPLEWRPVRGTPFLSCGRKKVFLILAARNQYLKNFHWYNLQTTVGKMLILGFSQILSYVRLKKFDRVWYLVNVVYILSTMILFTTRSSGAMDNASAYGAEDCRFDPCLDRFFFFSNITHFRCFEISNISKTIQLTKDSLTCWFLCYFMK